MNPELSLQAFADLLDTYGSDFRCWPAEEAEAAEALCQTSVEARAQYDEARALEALFRRDAMQPIDQARMTAILNGALTEIAAKPRRRAIFGFGGFSFDWGWLFTRPVGAALAASLVAGWILGSVAPDAASWRSASVPAVTALLGLGDGGGIL
ncbi:MAG TPA: hypothetical protein VL574_01175 [Stellaceae bacterium]|jgi:hypothetical protein|nr:hypothetical protein [Stellaceae bacterium]